MKKWKILCLFLLLSLPFMVSAQTMLLDETLNRFLIDDKSEKPRLDFIVRSFTTSEKLEIPRYAVIDTLTKPSVLPLAPHIYHVTAGRMAESMTLVIRNAEKLSKRYRLKLDGEEIKDDNITTSQIRFYLLNGEKCTYTFALPFGKDSLTLSLSNDHGEILSKIHISYTYPLPEPLYADIVHHLATKLTDTLISRTFIHSFNKVPTTYSRRRRVPDSLVIGEAKVYIGFKKAYYDGAVRSSPVRYWIHKKRKETDEEWHLSKKNTGNQPFRFYSTASEMVPYVEINHNNTKWDWMLDGQYELLFSYSRNPLQPGRYPFEIRHHWLKTWQYNMGGMLWIAAIILFTKPWLTFILISALIYFYIRRRLRKIAAQAQKANLELQAIQSQLNPHFIFNALGSLQGLINKQETEKANTYLTEFSKLLRNTLNNSGKEMVPLSVEISDIENYIRLEQLRFGFEYKIITDNAISAILIEVPSLLIQPVVENAIKHGISRLANAGLITVAFTALGKDLLITIADNGKGFDPLTHPEGKGLSLTRERIKLLNKQRYHISMDISSSPSGTKVKLTFNQWL